MRLSAGMCNFLAYDLDQSMGRILPKLPVIVHHILKTRSIFINIQHIVLHLINVIQCEKIWHVNQHFNVNNFGYTCIGWYPTIIRGPLPITAIPTGVFDMYRMWKEEDWIKDKLSIYQGCATTGLHWVAKQVLERQEVEFPPFHFMALLTLFCTHTHTHTQAHARTHKETTTCPLSSLESGGLKNFHQTSACVKW